MVKLHVEIIVQGPQEEGAGFAKRIEEIALLAVRKASEKGVLQNNPTLLVTSDSKGRQTASLQFVTYIEEVNV